MNEESTLAPVDPRGGTFIDCGDGRGPIYQDDATPSATAPETPAAAQTETAPAEPVHEE